MMKTIAFEYGPKTIYLYFNGEAMFQIDALDEQKPANQPEAMELMQEQTSEGLAMLCEVAVILATQGELCRRYLHYAPARVPTAKELLLILSPMQTLNLRTAVIRAINAGWTQSVADTDGDVDTGLAELEKKTTI